MTYDDDTSGTKDMTAEWARLAGAALDLWQDHLTALANDPEAKKEMARFVAPMSQMFSFWTDWMDQGLQGMKTYGADSDEEPFSAYDTAVRDDERTQGPVAESAPEPAPEPVVAESVVAEQIAEPVVAESPASDGPVAVESRDVEAVLPDDGAVRADIAAVFESAPEPRAEPSPEPAAEPLVTAEARLEAILQSVREPDAPVPAEDRSAASASRARDLADLAERLAYLERELDGLRARKREDGSPEAEREAG